MFCKECGSEISANAVVCTKCGVPTHKATEVSQGILVAGYALAFIMPLIGGIVGIYLMAKGKPEHGIGTLSLALFSFFFWFGAMG